jgi:oligopeptide/dipeptide ABC transporter ATP-binding protein
MYAGEIVEHGPVEEIFARPLHPYTRGLIAAVPVPGKVARGAPLGSIPGVVPSLVGGITGCAFRDRCPLAHDACVSPAPRQMADAGRTYRCHLAPVPAAALRVPA